MNTPIKLIVGLGNPGSEYDHTRHNAGADFVSTLAEQCNATLVPDAKFFGLATRITLDGQDVRLLIPTTFMNRSGQAVAAIAQFYKIPVEAILVAHDELDLAPGVARFKLGGGHGGHNGLRDIISALGNNKAFARLRIGIDHPGNAKAVSGYVLRKAPANERELIDNSIALALNALSKAASGQWNDAMKQLHTQ